MASCVGPIISGVQGEPVSHFLFGWLPFEMWVWFGDYCVIGALIVASMRRAYREVLRPRPGARFRFFYNYPPVVMVFQLVFWPITLFTIWSAGIAHKHGYDEEKLKGKVRRRRVRKYIADGTMGALSSSTFLWREWR